MSLIGVFDSGVGGLTVLKSLYESYPGHDFIYLADTARLPYGTKSAKTISSYLDRNVEFLKKHNVDFIIVACNSASTVLIEGDPAQKMDYGIPVFNVIEPGSEEALRVSKNKVVGVLGTRTTVLSRAYPKTLTQKDKDVKIHQAAAPLLVPLVEEGWVADPITSMIVYRYTKPLLEQGVDTIILGCTHYPVLHQTFQKVCGNAVELVDSPRALKQTLKENFPDLDSQTSESKKGMIRIYCTDLTPHLEQVIGYLMAPYPYQPAQMVDI